MFMKLEKINERNIDLLSTLGLIFLSYMFLDIQSETERVESLPW